MEWIMEGEVTVMYPGQLEVSARAKDFAVAIGEKNFGQATLQEAPGSYDPERYEEAPTNEPCSP